MNFRIGTHGRAMGRGPATALVTIILVVAVAGCGARHTEQAPAASRPAGESSDQTTVVASTQGSANGPESSTRLSESARPGPVHRITLSNRRCIRFEPQWTSVRVGQSITWHSELRTPMRIYVSPGVFDRVSFLVRPGATVSTGPARSVGRFSFWTEPCACREAPRGVLLAGPGVRVRDTFFASAPGVH